MNCKDEPDSTLTAEGALMSQDILEGQRVKMTKQEEPCRAAFESYACSVLYACRAAQCEGCALPRLQEQQARLSGRRWL